MDKELELLNIVVKFIKDNEKDMDEYAIDRVTQYLADRYVTEFSAVSLRSAYSSISGLIDHSMTNLIAIKNAARCKEK